MSFSSLAQFQIVIPALVALIVVVLGHSFTVWRDRQNRRREQRIAYLISVYRAFCKANHHPRIFEVAEEIEQAVADVQLFGTPEQVRLVQEFADDMGAKQEASLNELLLSLRDSLRDELSADPLTRRHVWIKIEGPPNKSR